MDNLAHTLTGIAMARAGLARRYGRGTTLLLALASNVPDVDALLTLHHGVEAPTHRRMFTHSVLGVPVLAVLLALTFRRRRGNVASFAELVGLGALGVGVHVFMDLVNSYGVVLLAPLSDWRPELAWTFIMDLAIWAILLAPLALQLTPARRLGVERLSRASLLLLALYLGLCGLGHWRAQAMVERAALAADMAPGVAHVFPEALGPHRFRGVARDGDLYRMWLLHVWSGRVESMLEVRTEAQDEEIAELRRQPWPRRIEWFFKAPVWRRVKDDEGREVIEVYDLRFRSAVLPRRSPFVYRFPVAGGL